jgi:hypothetical protein
MKIIYTHTPSIDKYISKNRIVQNKYTVHEAARAASRTVLLNIFSQL